MGYMTLYEERKQRVFGRARHFFPHVALPNPDSSSGRRTKKDPIRRLKDSLHCHIKLQLSKLELKDLMKMTNRENGVQLCVYLGMNEEAAKMKFAAQKMWEDALGVVGTTPTIDMIYHLLQHIEYDNPSYGEPTDGEFIQHYKTVEHKDGSKLYLDYMSLNMSRGAELQAVTALEEWLGEAGYDDHFMHGTTASVLQKVEELARITQSEGTHDFGDGVYCTKNTLQNDLKMAVLSALDRSWPDSSKFVDNRRGNSTKKGNAAIVLFCKQPEIDASRWLDVDNAKVESEEDLKAFFGPGLNDKSLERLLVLREGWSKDRMAWKSLVNLARFYRIYPCPVSHQVRFGTLHGADTTVATDMCNEPTPDRDDCKQYSFVDPDDLGNEMLFIEFHMDWESWFPNGLDNYDDEALKRAARRCKTDCFNDAKATA
ncbi:expressed unknown protein [Seminavis robusta]|uniref:Uncharacterized protein n=1 Tax=Seminavis robusta TaxID=568900 RepID=A0A9N8DJC9_9STRA|nr:expressed unknown protein [Seminavis robusta]|eukprot:Sro154_g069940.1 n/a (428) ;mRNA; r:28395-29678